MADQKDILQSKDEEKKVVVEGEVISILPGLEYEVKVDFQGMEHIATCYVSGKMKSHYIQLEQGDKVKVEISLYDIDRGRITYRLTKRRMSAPPRRPKK